MNENVLTSGRNSKLKKRMRQLFLLCLRVSVGSFFLYLIVYYLLSESFGDAAARKTTVPFVVLIISGLVLASIFGVLYSCMASCFLEITRTGIRGCSAFGRRVGLPAEKLTAVRASRLLGTLTVSTTTGKLRFIGIENRDAVVQTLRELMAKCAQTENAS